jgi:aspartate racemase
MKRLGIVGGIGPESTIVYYRALIAAVRERLDGAALPILINSIDVHTVLRLAEDDPVPGLRDYLLSEISVLARGGASIALIAANTPHMVFDEIRQGSPIELVSIVEATRDVARERALNRIGLFGTKFTMQGRFYSDVLSPSQIELVRPRDDEQAYIHRVYVEELLNNIFRPETRDRLLAIAAVMEDRDGVQAVILAGTELPLLLTNMSTSPVPLLDTTEAHVKAALKRLLD